MTGCNATFETLTRTDETVATLRLPGLAPPQWYGPDIPDGVTVTRDGDRLLRDEVTVLTCALTPLVGHARLGEHMDSTGRVWTDGWPGATPHTDPDPCPDCGAPPDGYGCFVDCPGGTRPAVTDTEVEAALDAHVQIMLGKPPEEMDKKGEAWITARAAMRVALEAADRARQENRDA